MPPSTTWSSTTTWPPMPEKAASSQCDPTWQSWAMWTLFMIRLSSPMRVQPPPFSVPMWMETYSRMMLSSPMARAVVSPEKPRTWGSEPRIAKGKTRVRAPIDVFPMMLTWEPISTSSASSTPSPITT